MKQHLGIFYMILSGLFFGGVWYFSKLVVQDLAPFMFTTLRMTAALIVLSILGYKHLPSLMYISSRDWKRIILTSLFGMVRGAICLTFAVKRTTITNSSFLFFLPAALLPIRGSLFSDLKLKGTTYLAVGLCILGLYLLFDPELIGTSFKGNVMGLLAGLSYLIYIVSSKKLSHLSPSSISITIFLVMVIILAGITFFFEGINISDISFLSWKLVGYIGLCMAGAYFFLNKALQHLSSYFVGVLAIGEPLAATALGVLFLGEIITTSAFIGLGAILLGFGLINMDKGLME